MKKLLFIAIGISLLAAACQKVTLEHETPTSPVESYQPLPK